MHQDPSMYSSQVNLNPSQFPEHEHLKCPRCDSSNTKFCYYNNYNLSQPRHFCKNCRRYWTKGGTLRNIPVGGATRKITKRSSKRPSISSPSPDAPPPPPPPPTEGGGESFRSQLGSLLMDGLSANLGDGSGENSLIRTRAEDLFGSMGLSLNRDDNRSASGGEESSCWNGGSGLIYSGARFR